MNSGDFWAMGGYARYVWPCISFGLAVLAWNLWSAQRFHAAARVRARRAMAMSATAGAAGRTR